jgi:hypothetical protein
MWWLCVSLRYIQRRGLTYAVTDKAEVLRWSDLVRCFRHTVCWSSTTTSEIHIGVSSHRIWLQDVTMKFLEQCILTLIDVCASSLSPQL